MTVAQMRNAIIKVYPSDIWKHKVNKMYDDQVIAIYYKFAKEGKFEKAKKVKSCGLTGKQLSFSFKDM